MQQQLGVFGALLKAIMPWAARSAATLTDHLINPPTVDANGTLIGTTVINGETVNLWSENTNTLYITPPGNNSAPKWTYGYEFGNSNTLINQELGATIAGAAVPGANDTSADALNILPYYPSANGQEGYLNGGWTGVGSGSPNAFGYIAPPTRTRSISRRTSPSTSARSNTTRRRPRSRSPTGRRCSASCRPIRKRRSSSGRGTTTA